MSQAERHKRLRLLLKKHNKERKRQSHKIDILCNDLIGAQGEFMRRLNNIGFTARFYKDLLGVGDLRNLLLRAGRFIRAELPGAHVTFFLRYPEGGEWQVVESDTAGDLADQRLEDCFTRELLEAVCKSNRPCTVDDLVGMGLAGNPAGLKRISLATVPLSDLGRPLGFVLVYRAAPPALSRDELERIGLITCGLARAIRGACVPLHSPG